MANASDVVVKIGGDTAAFKESLAGMGSELLTTIGEINPVVAGVVGTIAGIGTAAIESAEVFQEAYNTIAAKTGATGEDLQGLKESFDTVFLSVPGDAQGVAEALSLISDRLHITGDDLTALTTQMAQLSLASGTDIKENADAATKAFQNWNIATEDQGHSLDILNSVSQQYGINVTQLTASVADIGNVARLSGESFEQTANQVGLMTSKGIDAQTMFSAISKGMAQARKDGADLSDVTMASLIARIEQAKTPTDALNVAMDEFGAKVGPKMAQMVKDGIISSADLMNTHFKDATDSVKNTYAATDTFGRQLTVLKDNLMVFLTPLGEFIVGVGKDFLSWLNTAVVGVESIYYAMTGNADALKKLTDSYDAANPKFQDATTKLQGNKAVADALKATNTDLGISIVGVSNSATEQAARLDAAKAAHEALIVQAKLLEEATTILSGADSQHAENIKATYTPALLDLATAQNNVNLYKQEAISADQNLTQTEQTLRELIASHTASNTELKDAEDAVTLAKASSKVANENLSEAEKTLTASKTDDTAITNLLKTATQAIAEAIKTDHVPATLSLVDAENAVTVAKLATQDAIQKEKDAVQALSEFQNQTGFRDATTEKQLKDDVTTATTNLTAARNTEAQAIKDASTIKQESIALDNDILANKKLLDSFTRDNELGTMASLGDAITNINKLKADQKTASEALATALQAEQALQASGTVDVKAETDARTAAKKAADDYKASTDQLNTAEALAAKNYGLSKDAIILLTTNTNTAAGAATALQAAYNVMGLKSADSLQALATAADTAYTDIKNSGTKSADTLLAAQLADLTAQANAIKATGDGSVPAAMQIQLAALKTKQGDFITDSQTQWSTLYTNIDGTVKNFADSAIHTLFTGDGSFKDEGLKALESIGESIVDTFTKKATDAIASFISGAITDLLSGKGLGGVLDSLTKIGSTVTGLFSSTSSIVDAAGNSAAGAGGAITDIGGAAGSAAGAAGSAGGGAASAVGSTLGAVSNVFGMVTGAISAVTGILSLFGVGQGGQKDRLDIIANKTSFLSWCFDEGGLHKTFLDDNNVLHYFLDTSFNGWYKDWLDDTSHLLYEMNDRDKSMNQHLEHLDFGLTYDDGIVPLALANLAKLVNQPPVVNITNTLNGTQIASIITTTVENSIKAALG